MEMIREARLFACIRGEDRTEYLLRMAIFETRYSLSDVINAAHEKLVMSAMEIVRNYKKRWDRMCEEAARREGAHRYNDVCIRDEISLSHLFRKLHEAARNMPRSPRLGDNDNSTDSNMSPKKQTESQNISETATNVETQAVKRPRENDNTTNSNMSPKNGAQKQDI